MDKDKAKEKKESPEKGEATKAADEHADGSKVLLVC